MASDKAVFDKLLLRSVAYRGLPANARDVFHEFLLRRRMERIKQKKQRVWICTNNGEICFTYDDAEKMGISRATFARCLDKLVERGLIDITHHGNGGVKGDVSLYAISERWRNFGTARYQKAHRPKDPRQGESLRKYHREKKDKFQS